MKHFCDFEGDATKRYVVLNPELADLCIRVPKIRIFVSTVAVPCDVIIETNFFFPGQCNENTPELLIPHRS